MLRSATLRRLTAADRPEIVALLERDPVANVFVTSRVEASAGNDRLGAELWGYYDGGRLAAACYSGANLVPVEADESAAYAFADYAAREGRRCSSIVGLAGAVLPLWARLRPSWGPAREERLGQPVMAIDTKPAIAPDPFVRPVGPAEIDILLPASVAMFTEEVGVSPVADGGMALYRARVAELIRHRRTFARIEGGKVVFKADIGAVSSHACQVQGVWVDPTRRGEGIAAPAMAAVVEHALAEIAPVVSLYVNDFNLRARAAYRSTGFREVTTFASVLF